MAKKRSTKKKGLPGVSLALVLIFVIAGALYITGGTEESHGTPNADARVAESRALLEQLAAEAPVDLNAEIHRQYLENLKQRQGIMVDDLEAEQQKILAMQEGDWNKAELARWFEDAALVGDSIVRATRGYGWLDAPVIAKGGVRVSGDLELLDEIEAAAPSVIFLCFGMNDVGVYKADVGTYVTRYTDAILRLRQSLPEAIIYVHATFPVNEKALAKRSTYGYIDLYNEEMRKVCPQLGVYWVDSGFLLLEKPELYDADGIHPKRYFYPLWLTYLADIAGLNEDE